MEIDRARFKIAPSDLTFLLFGCQRCFYLKVVHGIRQPVSIPRVFTVMDAQQRAYFDGAPASAIEPGLPEGRLSCADATVESAWFALRGRQSILRFRGALDALAEYDDGSVGVIDFKTTDPTSPHVELYTMQLHAYAHAIERPVEGEGRAVATLGLLCFQPSGIQADGLGLVSRLEAAYLPVDRDDMGFLAVMDLAVGLLELDAAPPPAKSCSYCRFANAR